MKSLKYLTILIFLFSLKAVAAIPPPPVNQNIGIPDTSFSNYDQTLCQSCHWASARDVDPLNGAPVKLGYNPNRHHLAVGTPIDGKPEMPPFPDADGDGRQDSHFTCFSCHVILSPGNINTAVLLDVIKFNYRDCLSCHKRETGPLTVHHTTNLAQTGYCFKCHGGLVRGIDVNTLEGKKPDPNDINKTVPVRIPTYSESLVTPWRSDKPYGDDLPENLSIAGKMPGNCNYCHNVDSSEESDVINGDGKGDPDAFGGGVLQTVTLPNGSRFTVPVLTNAQNHHNTGFFDDQKCAWCHEIDGVFQEGAEGIRVCQRCHDRSTLHNIEFDAVGDGITPGAEEPYYGHIGNNDNCWGCHGFSEAAREAVRNRTLVSNQGIIVSNDENARIDTSASLIPTIRTLSTQSSTAGVEVLVTITGQSIVNSSRAWVTVTDESGNLLYDDQNQPILEIKTFVWHSDVVITDKENVSILLESDYQDHNKLEFILPATLAPGVYQVSVKKRGGHVSNPIGLTVTPAIRTQESFVYTPFGGLTILTGQNFMDSIKGRTYKMVDQNGQAPLTTYMWRDDLIIALFREIPESVTITHLFDEKTIPLNTF